jgi:alpha-maltose-1-phosphate synthase
LRAFTTSDMNTVHLLRKYDPAEWGGTETALRHLFDGLRQNGVASVLFCPRLSREPAADPLRDAGCRVERFRAFLPVWGMSGQRKQQLVSIGGNLMSFDLIRALSREKNTHIIHTHTLGRLGGIGLTIAKRRRIPFVVTIHGGILDLPPALKQKLNTRNSSGWEWGRIFGLIFDSHHLLRDADAILTCNPAEANLLREKHPARRILVQPHGLPVALYQRDRREDALKSFPQIAGKQALLCVGRIDPVKNQLWLVEQMPAILNRHPDSVLVLAGACTDAAYGAALQRRITEQALPPRVLLTGGLPPADPRLIGLFQHAKLLILPSQSETFGLVILEAWATGAPVLSSRTSGACGLIDHGRNGWLFDLTEPQRFHELLDQSLGRSEAVTEIIKRGVVEVNERFSYHRLANQLKQLYEQLIEEKHALRHHS